MSASSDAASAGAGGSARSPSVAAAALDILLLEYHHQLQRTHDSTTIGGREDMFEKIEGTGYRVGRRFAEHLSRDSDRLLTALEVMKFVAREVWNEVFGKPMSKLQTNNKGVFLLQDSDFRWTRYVSGSPAEGETPALALKYCVFACGLIRGCLAAFDLAYLVNVDVSALPKVVFQARQVIPPSLQQQEQQRQLMAQQQQQP